MPEEVDCLASLHPDGTVAALVWRHADDQYSADSASAEVALRFTGLPAPSYALTEYRIDASHSNSHTVWQSLGEPQDPDESTLGQIRARQGLETHGAPNRMMTSISGELLHRTTLPLPSVSLVVLEPC
jgi:xylan 1,4-beta-xylosidase